jgi:hypothetical protein
MLAWLRLGSLVNKFQFARPTLAEAFTQLLERVVTAQSRKLEPQQT